MHLSRAASLAFGAAFFALPLSKSATLTFAGIGCVLVLAGGAVLDDLRARRLPPWWLPLAVLAAMPLLSPWIHEDGASNLAYVSLGWHWLIAAFVWVAAGRARIDRWLVAFLAGLSISFAYALAMRLGLATPVVRPAALGNYILHSQFLVTGVLAAAMLHREAVSRPARLACWALALAFAYGIATEHGRTGQLALLALLPLVLSALMPKRGFAVLAVACVVGTAALLTSPAVRERIAVASAELEQFRSGSGAERLEGPDGLGNSLGFRWEMWRLSGELFGAHPLLGAGPAAFEREWKARAGPLGARFVEPHNAYAFHAAAYGLAGLVSLVALWTILLIDGWRRRDRLGGGLAMGFGIVCILGGVTNTMVFGTTSAMWLMLFLGLHGATRPANPRASEAFGPAPR
jgi:hypothetical protein